MADLLRFYLDYTFHSLTKYDLMAIGWVVLLALLMLIMAIFIKRRSLSYFLFFLGFVLFFFGPPAIKIALDRIIRATEVTVTAVKPLKFSQTLLLEGNITDRGKIDFSDCDLLIVTYRPDTPLKTWAAWFKPRHVYLRRLNQPLLRGETKDFRLLVDPFYDRGDFNVTVDARCYP